MFKALLYIHFSKKNFLAKKLARFIKYVKPTFCLPNTASSFYVTTVL
jgi:hypothetical protein